MKNTAQSYAAALYELAREEKEEKKILDDLSVISAVFKAEEKYLKLLNSYAVEKKSEKDKLANDAFGGKLSGYSVNFIKLLASKNILNLIFDCEKEYARLYRKAHNIERASIIFGS
ncbi:MAG: ATP synthase F1 subunit delta [Clostridiales bacterium]|nr:MAG: ATP synthase F1 subunit delta [Clostridiales bacterium]